MKLTSAAFADGESIPPKYSCEGEGISPPLSWSEVPEGAESFVLLCEDPDAPGGTFKHWAAYEISAATDSLPEGVPARTSDFKQASNDFGDTGFGAPCPPPGHGAHHYNFEIWALDTDTLELGATPSYEQVRREAEKHKIDSAELTGTFQR